MLILSLIASAWASSSYPGALETELGMPCAPTCTLCHATNIGGPGTVVTPFGIAMGERGLTGGGNIAGLTETLDVMATDAVDSDGDGTSDLDELFLGADPNPDAAVFCDIDGGGEVVVPIYGCFGGAEGSGSAAGMGLGALLGLTALRRRARRGR
jgi:MYXO-CTERM domain-containing protein